MSDSTGTLLGILQDDGPVAAVYYSSFSDRERLLELAGLLAPPERSIRRTRDVEDAFRDPETLLLLTPEDEQNAVLTLDGRREALGVRTAPVVLFLLSGGSAAQHLRTDAPGLDSWLRGLEYDPDRAAPIDIEAERERFKDQTGLWPEEWLAGWRGGALDDTAGNNFLYHRASLMENPSDIR